MYVYMYSRIKVGITINDVRKCTKLSYSVYNRYYIDIEPEALFLSI